MHRAEVYEVGRGWLCFGAPNRGWGVLGRWVLPARVPPRSSRAFLITLG